MAVKIKGLDDLRNRLKGLEKESKTAINKGIQETAKLILSDMLSRIPVDKGLLRASTGIENKPDELTAIVYAKALYAAYQEFGSGAFTEVPAGYEDYAMEFYVDGTGTTKPQPFMFPALFANQEKLVPLVEAELIKLLNNG
jgi:HK97 gp10 family phage protein